VEAALQRVPKGAELLAGRDEKPFQVHEICLIKVKQERPDQEPQVIGRSIHPLVLPMVSPKHSAVAWWKVMEDHKVELVVSSLDGKTQVGVGSTSSVTFGWTPDGRSLVFPVPVSEGDRLFQTIRRITALDETGSLLKENRESLDLAVAIMPEPARLCVLPDGGVLFASQPAKLPALSSALDLEPRLFHVSPDGKAVREVPTAPGDLPANLSFFVPSPDGKRVAVVESDTVVVAVVELATGKTEIVAPPRAGWGCRTMPAWKSSTELTFAALDAATAPRWMRWKEGEGVRSISEKWPAAATRSWLNEKKDPEKPAKACP
jgi:Tol biopolymer transport system component